MRYEIEKYIAIYISHQHLVCIMVTGFFNFWVIRELLIIPQNVYTIVGASVFRTSHMQ